MKIDLTCPIEVTHTEVLSDDRGRCRGYLDIINVSEHPIRRMEGHARWLSETGALLSEVDVVFDGMRLMPHTRAQLTVAGEIPAADDIVFEPGEIAFADFSKGWTQDDSEVVEYDFKPEPPGPGRERLRGIAGQDAVCYPQMRGRDWVCVCGRLNPGSSHTCARCMRGRERVFAALREGAGGDWGKFDTSLERRERLNARREEMRAQTARANSRRREKRMHIIVGVGVGVLIVAALLMIGILLGYIIF